MELISSNASLEPYDGSRSQKSYNNVRRMLSMVYFHCKAIRNAANITTNFEKSRSKISHFWPQKSEKSPAKSWRDWLKAWSALLMRRNRSLHCAVFCMRLHIPENSNVRKTVSGMFIQFYIVCLNSAGTVYLLFSFFSVYLKWDICSLFLQLF